MVGFEVLQPCLLLPGRAAKMGVDGDRSRIGRVVENEFDHQAMFGQERLERWHANRRRLLIGVGWPKYGCIAVAGRVW
jgi:hypothetical protein